MSIIVLIFLYIVKRFMSFKCVPIYGLMFRILTRFHALYFGASCIHRNSIVWRHVNLARFPYWPEKRTRRISRYSYLMKTLISSEYGLTISSHVTVLRQWLSEKNTDYIINSFVEHKLSPFMCIYTFGAVPSFDQLHAAVYRAVTADFGTAAWPFQFGK